MTTRYLTTSGSPALSGGCGQENPPACCGGSECGTDCLSRPHFYCGMVLTDDKLNDLTQWVRRRSALHRYVEGWGVVRGLGVRCDPASPRSVLVGPGYARSCCGDDIVVCEDMSLDVCACQPAGPCCEDREEAAPGQERSGLRAVDIYLQYTEKQEEPAKVMSACGCGGHDGIQYERVAETGTLTCVPVADPSADPETLAATKWDQGYVSRSGVVDDYLREVSKEASQKDRRDWLVRWIDRAGDAALSCVRRWLCQLDSADWADWNASDALLEIVYALRNSYLQATYAQCQGGVLLARVWVVFDKQGRCTVRCIDSLPPYRRVLMPPGWPRKPGFINVAELIWQRRAIACEQVRRLGLNVTWSPYYPPGDVADLAGLFEGDSAFLPCDAVQCEAWLYRDHCGNWIGEDTNGRVLRLRELDKR